MPIRLSVAESLVSEPFDVDRHGQQYCICKQKTADIDIVRDSLGEFKINKINLLSTQMLCRLFNSSL